MPVKQRPISLWKQQEIQLPELENCLQAAQTSPSKYSRRLALLPRGT